MKGAEVEALILKAEGIDFITLYPDIELTNAAAEIGIRTIMPRNERVAVDIANGVSRVSNGNKIGVCAMQQGAGIQNAFSGVAQAWADSSPILILPEVAERRLLRTFPSYNAYDSYRNISKWCDTILFADQIPDLMRRGFTLLRTGKPGPVLLEMPVDVAREEYNYSGEYSPGKGWDSVANFRDIEIAIRAIRQAKNPVVYAGQGVLYAEAWEELKIFCELLQLPVLTTMTGKSSFPENHPLSLGVAAHVSTSAANYFLAKSDLVFAVGAGLSLHWMQAPIPMSANIIQLTNNEFDIGKGYPITHVLFGDAKQTLQLMIEEAKKEERVKEKITLLDEIKEKKKEWLQEWNPLITSDEVPINPLRLIYDLMNTINRENVILSADSGKSRDHASVLYEVINPRGYIGFGHSTTLGFTLGCSMGAKLVAPEKLVINLMGDGAFGMVGMDLETSVREKIPILTIVLNNSTLSTIGGFPTANRIYETGIMTGNYAEFADSQGAYGLRVEDPDDIVSIIKKGIKKVESGSTTLIEVITKLETKTSN